MKRLVSLSVVFSVMVIYLNAQPAELMIKKGDQGLYLDHTVAPKEGLYAIGRLYNVNPKYIALYNRIDLNAGLAIGQTIHIPLTDTNFSQNSFSGTPVYYLTGANDNLAKVSNTNNKVSLQKLRDWNGLKNDNLSPGSKLIVGFLNSKEMAAAAINNSVRQKSANTEKAITKTEPPKEEKNGRVEENVFAKNNAIQEKKQVVNEQPVPAVTWEIPGTAAPGDQGYFRPSFDQQVKRNPAKKNATVTAGIFKTNSGWQDAKYYMLIDDVPTGTIVKIVNPDNNKVIYAKVLGEMNGIRQNEGLDIRISNAAASILGVLDTEKFVLKVNY